MRSKGRTDARGPQPTRSPKQREADVAALHGARTFEHEGTLYDVESLRPVDATTTGSAAKGFLVMGACVAFGFGLDELLRFVAHHVRFT